MDQKEELHFFTNRLPSWTSVRYVIGCDEAGRGPWAGPVAVAAACYLLSSATTFPAALTDSKALSDEQRRQILDHYLVVDSDQHRNFFASAKTLEAPFGFVSSDVTDKGTSGLLAATSVFIPADVIDQKNILEASLDGMTTAAAMLVQRVNAQYNSDDGLPFLHAGNTVIVVDGPHTPWDLLSAEARADKEAKKWKAAETLAKRMQREHKKKLEEEEQNAVDEVKPKKKKKTKSTASHKNDSPLDLSPSATQSTSTSKELVIDVASLIPPRYPIAAELVGAVAGFPTGAFVKGDSRCPSIACASIFAKVMRDVYLEAVMHVKYPQYAFHSHKGYGTALHTELLKQHGPCPEHRRSYQPVAKALLAATTATSAAEGSPLKRTRDDEADL